MLLRNYFPHSKQFRYVALVIVFASFGLIACSSNESEDNYSNSAVEICNDGIDNDGDGFVDCEDQSCNSSTLCEEICNDGIDNDGDGFIDCEDANCEEFQDCLIERCIDGVDNDGDGLVDCDDPDCDSNPSCE
ncbi:S8/S53 family peptidase [Winogradskyella alexanderae]|uniref:Thrombospondin type 3 repeat-containing protein n=1 Tax=Winogradskyella alexanderae TaxID=2877123 RepID=A0ABS7XTX8_9FLAO|nr:hypothetical protein [Winogradskyella alexanderae]MCA0132266.1 hypothetical protein [Winogradskyella alexanderae]